MAKRARVEPTTLDRAVHALIDTVVDQKDKTTVRLLETMPKNTLTVMLSKLSLVDRHALREANKTVGGKVKLAVRDLRNVVVDGEQELQWFESTMAPPLDSIRELTMLNWSRSHLFRSSAALTKMADTLRKLSITFNEYLNQHSEVNLPTTCTITFFLVRSTMACTIMCSRRTGIFPTCAICTLHVLR
jgi:hypothetical protein